ncbi:MULTISPECIES: BolA family protein [unclassified Thermosynechococcus]|uniref:BolA family protein n=1 Tax=unclassified Thermosynechococcus TaxID=2622553 RepID=UPI00122E4DF2|nr:MULTISPECIES: BolA family transcriptional regulator [unclassified Thermosynechococcus]MDR5639589.1 BolA family transcriptional regulator [Thermosynechococcus sp. PP42]MDR7898679.1 BolA family transcriptional regulator [Thermosynechococcus sp. JY1332]MDR7906083.1 BolA family transcriptional regulator [Thermosynechococcus sp. JY1334]MDR7921737.1 BolA family transcriptional regulator [Thermosynechococcus sp. HY213]MDR7993902.1 BolA family transcriptional regulator [Thermosynechococcus sp. TG25
MVTPEQLTTLIQSSLPDAFVQVQDLTGGGDHYEAVVVSAAFEGKRLVQQHQLVYSSLKDLMASNELHALALKTYTPQQWAQRQ